MMSVDNQNATDISPNGSGRDSPPNVPMDSPGSSVSSKLQEEYSQLLKYTAESAPGFAPLLTSLGENNSSKESAWAGKDVGNISSGAQEPLTLIENANQNNATSNACQTALEDAVVCMGGNLDSWLGNLREKIMEELQSSVRGCMDVQQEEHKTTAMQIRSEKSCLEKKLNQLNDKLNTLETNLKQKCTLVENLTDSLAAQKEKVVEAKQFYQWKADVHNNQRECFTEKLAIQHHERKLNLRVLKAWFGLIQKRWRCRVERQCQAQAQGVCVELTNDYEDKVGMLNAKICCLEDKVSQLQSEKEAYAQQVKTALMRGMCALNMETKSVMGQDQRLPGKPGEGGVGGDLDEGNDQDEDFTRSDSPYTYPSDTAYRQRTSDLSQSGGTTSDLVGRNPSPDRPRHNLSPGRTNPACGKSTAAPDLKPKGKPKTKPAKKPQGHICGGSSPVLAPPMASVVVEKHQPVTKKTVGKATAVRYPKRTLGNLGDRKAQPGNMDNKNKIQYKPLAGQTVDNRDVFIKIVD